MNIGFKVPLPQEEAEKNEGLREFTAALAIFLCDAIPETEQDQAILVTLKHCDMEECPNEYPHLLESIVSERQMSEEFLLNLSKLSDFIVTQREERITFEYL